MTPARNNAQRNKLVKLKGLTTLDRLLLGCIVLLQVLILQRLGRFRSPPEEEERKGPASAEASAESPVPERRNVPDLEGQDTVPAAARPMFGWPVRSQPSAHWRQGAISSDDVGRLFNRGWDRLQRSPAMDVVELADAFVVVFSVPDVSEKDVVVHMDHGVLTVDLPIFAESEGRYGRMVRRLQIPGVVTEAAPPEFVLTNGFLKVHLPKH